MVTDLISRQTVIERLNDVRVCLDDEGQQFMDILIKTVEDLPFAESDRGEWEHCRDDDGEYDVCSLCGMDVDISHSGKSYNFCPHCGARMESMRKEKNNGIR